MAARSANDIANRSYAGSAREDHAEEPLQMRGEGVGMEAGGANDMQKGGRSAQVRTTLLRGPDEGNGESPPSPLSTEKAVT